MTLPPEQKARQDIDAALVAAGWIIQDRADMNLAAGPGVAVREFRMTPGHGFADYLLFVNGKAVGADSFMSGCWSASVTLGEFAHQMTLPNSQTWTANFRSRLCSGR